MDNNTSTGSWYKQIPAGEVNHTERDDGALNIERIPVDELLASEYTGEYVIHTRIPALTRVGFSQIILQIDDDTAYDVTDGFTSSRKKREYSWAVSGVKADELRELVRDAVQAGKEPVVLLVCEHVLLWHYPMFFLGWYAFGRAVGL